MTGHVVCGSEFFCESRWSRNSNRIIDRRTRLIILQVRTYNIVMRVIIIYVNAKYVVIFLPNTVLLMHCWFWCTSYCEQ